MVWTVYFPVNEEGGRKAEAGKLNRNRRYRRNGAPSDSVDSSVRTQVELSTGQDLLCRFLCQRQTYQSSPERKNVSGVESGSLLFWDILLRAATHMFLVLQDEIPSFELVKIVTPSRYNRVST